MMRSTLLSSMLFCRLAVHGQRLFIDPANLDTTVRPGNDFNTYTLTRV